MPKLSKKIPKPSLFWLVHQQLMSKLSKKTLARNTLLTSKEIVQVFFIQRIYPIMNRLQTERATGTGENARTSRTSLNSPWCVIYLEAFWFSASFYPNPSEGDFIFKSQASTKSLQDTCTHKNARCNSQSEPANHHLPAFVTPQREQNLLTFTVRIRIISVSTLGLKEQQTQTCESSHGRDVSVPIKL